MTEDEQIQELNKCKDSPAHFYNNYIRKEDQPEVTDEQIEYVKWLAASPIHRRLNHPYNLYKSLKHKHQSS